MQNPSIFKLNCQAMNYDWGVQGEQSLVAQLLEDQPIDPNLPYAELWMGIHPNAPSKVSFGNGEYLSEILQQSPALLGELTKQRWGTLPFLFKVLSIAKPLSIQMHPNKAHAEQLHAKDPKHYPDANHKPEILLALENVKALVGLKPPEALEKTLISYPILKTYFQEHHTPSNGSSDGVSFSKLLPTLLNLPETQGNELLESLYNTIKSKTTLNDAEHYFVSLYPQFSNDLGLLFVLFMPIQTIPTGTSLFLHANLLHAYLRGNLVECMANSDNVIRAGITNKFKDVEQMLTHMNIDGPAPSLDHGLFNSSYVKCFSTAAEEFELHSIELPASKSVSQEALPVPGIMIALSGEGTLESESNLEIQKGSVVFLGANQAYSITAESDLHLVRAIVPYVI